MGTETPRVEQIDADHIRDAVERALAEGPAPRYEDLVTLDAKLRGHIKQLLPAAQARVDALWRGSPEWSSGQGFLNVASYHLTSGLGPGLASAVHHVRRLARTCQTLIEYTQDEA